MDPQISHLFRHLLDNRLLIKAVFSDPKEKGNNTPIKFDIRPVHIKNSYLYQISKQIGAQAFHVNMDKDECEKFLEEAPTLYRQGILFTQEGDYHLLSNKGRKTTLLKKKGAKQSKPLLHNKEKRYLLQEGAPFPFLIELGIMNQEGKVLAQKRDKFIQVNKFLEMVQDTLSVFQKGQTVNIVDFGCGKAYLTFALYHFLKTEGFLVHMVGIDLKEEVLSFCTNLAQKLEYENLRFCKSDIADYNTDQPIDLVIALHACNTATDSALAKGVLWNAKVILAAPCCQHELYNQIESESLQSILQHGILKERFAALATDAARAELLQASGYKTQVIEFISSDHTAKNLAIKAIRTPVEKNKEPAKKRYLALKEALHITPFLETLLP